MTQTYAVPPVLRDFAGEIMDADSHEYTPLNYGEDQFGSVVRDFVDAFASSKMPIAEFVESDSTDITADTVWNTKFARAPGAFDLERRLEVLDLTGVRRQMMFPGSVGLYAVSFYFRADAYPDMLKSISGDRRGYALKLISAYNDFCIRVAKQSDRLRPVGIAFAPTVDELYAETKRMVDNGVRALWIPSAALPGGVRKTSTSASNG
jgi:hypothetical protein